LPDTFGLLVSEGPQHLCSITHPVINVKRYNRGCDKAASVPMTERPADTGQLLVGAKRCSGYRHSRKTRPETCPVEVP
jgi:hypothetical protein